ncbi:GNAT family N-acetyltransferase [Thermosulfurimonas marina]|uniref:GNAT family N-acetyltransferase n=1 Tax=Thermosulfurimonas marina TaxID=2047767 RepID=A0A6H1WR21_9BACT|nr:GNAT family N-acetyltransferase [Thermosulfurimonas marina]QJA05665.1 GNAT family N-acetyltransferase [Thermosulfurimonas marina]
MHLKKIDRPHPELLEKLVELYERAYQEDLRYAEIGRRRIKRYLKWLFKHARGAFWVAFEGEEPVGFVALEEMGPVPEIHEIVVSPEWRGRSLAEKLMQEALDYLSRRGFSRVALWVGEHNQRARHFYEKMGFQITEKAGVWLRMEKELQERERASSLRTRQAVSASESERVSSGV